MSEAEIEAKKAAPLLYSRACTPLDNLAVLYNASRKPEVAKKLFRRALAIFERVLGPKHPNTAA